MNKNKTILILFFLIIVIGIIGAGSRVYAADCGGATPCNCGDTVTSSYALTGDMTCTGSCLIVGADGITIDGSGYTITGDGGTGDYGINNSGGYDNITIQNFGNITNFGRGIYFLNSSDSIIQNNIINLNSYGIYISSDWTELRPAGDFNKNWWTVASDSDGSHLIAAVSGGRLYTSDDYGATWTERYPPGGAPADKSWRAVASDSDGSHLIAAVYDGRLYTSSNSGATWDERYPPGGAPADKSWRAVTSDSDGSHLIAAVFGGRLYTSSNSGVTWDERYPPGGAPADKNWVSVASDSDGSHLIATVNGGRLYTGVSADGGVTYTWTERYPPGGVPANGNWDAVASDSDGSHLIAAAFTGRLYTSGDYGATWTERQPAGDINKDWISVASDSDGSRLIAAVFGGRLYTSGDYGATWIEHRPAGDVNKNWRAVASDSDGSRLIAGIYQGRLYSLDAGSSSFNTLTNNTTNSNTNSGIYLYFSDSNNISYNTADSNNAGIYLYLSNFNNLSYNTANSNNYGYRNYSSYYNTFTGNTINDNALPPGYPISNTRFRLQSYQSFMITLNDAPAIAPIGTGDFSLSFWYQSPTKPTPYISLNICHDIYVCNRFVCLSFANLPLGSGDPMHYSAFMRDGASFSQVDYDVDDPYDTEPHLLVMSVQRNSATGLKLYYDGNLVGTSDDTIKFNGLDFTASATPPEDNVGGGVYINSGDGNGQSNPFLDEIRVYVGAALNQSQVSDIYNSGVGKLVDEAEFSTIASDGCYMEFDDQNTATPLVRKFSGDVWSDDTGRTFLPVNLRSVAGGLPYKATITSSAGFGGAISPSGTNFENWDEPLAFTATSYMGFSVDNWYVDGSVVRSGGDFYVLPEVDADRTVTVDFCVGGSPISETGSDDDDDGADCCIATAVYGSPMSPEINSLRNFRDGYLLTNPIGEVFVSVYYEISPLLAKVITRNPILRNTAKSLFAPLVFAITDNR